MIFENRLAKVKLVEQLTLITLQTAHHGSTCVDSRRHNGITVGALSQPTSATWGNSGSGQTEADQLSRKMRPAPCGLATMESDNGILCRTGRVVEADINLRRVDQAGLVMRKA